MPLKGSRNSFISGNKLESIPPNEMIHSISEVNYFPVKAGKARTDDKTTIRIKNLYGYSDQATKRLSISLNYRVILQARMSSSLMTQEMASGITRLIGLTLYKIGKETAYPL